MVKTSFKRKSPIARPQNADPFLMEIVKELTVTQAAAYFCQRHFTHPLKVDTIDRRGLFTFDGLSERIVYRAFRDKTPEGRTRYRIARVYGEQPDILTAKKIL